MSHGNIVTTTGTCPVCHREDAALGEYMTAAGTLRLACVDEFACADAWAQIPEVARSLERLKDRASIAR